MLWCLHFRAAICIYSGRMSARRVRAPSCARNADARSLSGDALFPPRHIRAVTVSILRLHARWNDFISQWFFFLVCDERLIEMSEMRIRGHTIIYSSIRFSISVKYVGRLRHFFMGWLQYDLDRGTPFVQLILPKQHKIGLYNDRLGNPARKTWFLHIEADR